MAGGGGGTPSRELDQTPTWAVALVCAVIIVISACLEKVLHHIGLWFEKRRKSALREALEKIKSELMVLGFISLLMTFGQPYIAKICISVEFANTLLPCPLKEGFKPKAMHLPIKTEPAQHRRLLWNEHRFLAGDSSAEGCSPGHVPLISIHGLHQLHIFIFFLAVFHVIYSALTMTLGRSKIRKWKEWERQIHNDNENSTAATKVRLVHDMSFVRRHTSSWTNTPFFFYIACFFRQFFSSVRHADYLTMRNGFISVHFAPGTKFNFQKYIKRSLEEDFKIVVGISPILWASAVLYMLLNVNGWRFMSCLSIWPPIIILTVGTKLQAIITKMAVEIQDRHVVVLGIPLVQVSDNHFWFGWPPLILYLIHLSLFQNAFELTYIFWTSYEFGVGSCFHESASQIILRVAIGLAVHILCSYKTLPLYALVTQMGSTVKMTIFDEQTSKAIKKWQKSASKRINEAKTAAAASDASAGVPNKSAKSSPSTSSENIPC